MGTCAKIPIFLKRFSGVVLVLCLAACVGTGSEGTSGGPLGGPVGPAPNPGALPSVSGGSGISGQGATGETQVAMGAPEMPDVPVAPQTDVEDLELKAKAVKYRIEGKILEACVLTGADQIKKKFFAQLLCRFEGSTDPFIPCGKGRHIKVSDPVTHHFINVQTSMDESRFEWEFRFNMESVGAQSWSSKHAMLLAYNRLEPDGRNIAALNDSQNLIMKDSVGIGSSPTWSPPEDEGPDIPDLFGEPNDPEDQNLISDESDFIFYAKSADQTPPQELGVQTYCNFPDMCEPGPLGSHIYLGAMTLIDLALTGEDLPDSLPACPPNP